MGILNFKEFLVNIMEGLSEPVDVNWEKNDNLWKGIFSINECDYEIIIKNFSKTQKHFLFKFTMNNSFDMANDLRKALSVIPTIENAATYFIEEVKPEAFIFTALDKSIGRKKMYSRYCEKISSQKNMLYDSHNKAGIEIFILKTVNCDDIELATVTLPSIYREQY